MIDALRGFFSALLVAIIAFSVIGGIVYLIGPIGDKITVLTDTKTGCQYLARSGNLTPRLGHDGKQICEEQ